MLIKKITYLKCSSELSYDFSWITERIKYKFNAALPSKWHEENLRVHDRCHSKNIAAWTFILVMWRKSSPGRKMEMSKSLQTASSTSPCLDFNKPWPFVSVHTRVEVAKILNNASEKYWLGSLWENVQTFKQHVFVSKYICVFQGKE